MTRSAKSGFSQVNGAHNPLNALADAKHPDYAEVSAYFEDWNPEEIEERQIRTALDRIANFRNAVRTRIAKKRT